MFDPITATIGAVGAIGGAIIGKDASRKASNTAADAQANASQQATDTQLQMFNQANEYYRPFREAGERAIPTLEGYLNQFPESNYLSQIQGIQPGTSEQQYFDQLAALSPNINIDLQNSPVYQAQKDELLRTLGNQYSARGLSGSSAAEDAIVRNLSPLIGQEYGRQVDQYGRQYNALSNLYGLSSEANQRQYGNQLNQLYNLYNLQSDIGNRGYGRALDLTKIGAGAAGQAGSGALSTGANIAQTQLNTGNALANITQQQGQNNANFYSQLGALPLQAYGTYQTIQSLQPPTYSPTGYGTGGSYGTGTGYQYMNVPGNVQQYGFA